MLYAKNIVHIIDRWQGVVNRYTETLLRGSLYGKNMLYAKNIVHIIDNQSVLAPASSVLLPLFTNLPQNILCGL
jgi:hypothetical protein